MSCAKCFMNIVNWLLLGLINDLVNILNTVWYIEIYAHKGVCSYENTNLKYTECGKVIVF